MSRTQRLVKNVFAFRKDRLDVNNINGLDWVLDKFR